MLDARSVVQVMVAEVAVIPVTATALITGVAVAVPVVMKLELGDNVVPPDALTVTI